MVDIIFRSARPALVAGAVLLAVMACETVRNPLEVESSSRIPAEKVETPAKVRERRPVLLVERAVWGMIPKTRLGRTQFGKLNVYAGESHPHEAQQPAVYEVR